MSISYRVKSCHMVVGRMAALIAASAFPVLIAACAAAGPQSVGQPVEADATSSQSTQSEPPEGPLYSSVSQILQGKCARCHGGSEADAGLSLETWATLIAGSDFGEAIIPFDPDNSLLVELSEKRIGGAHPRELGAETLDASEVDRLRKWIAAGARSDDGEVPFAESRDLVFVVNQGEASISIIETRANVVARRVDLTRVGFSKTAKPHHIAVEDDGSNWYVSLIGENRVVKFNRENEVIGKAAMEVPGLLVLDEPHDRLYVGRSMSAVNAPSSIGVISLRSGEVDEIEVYIPRPHALAVSPGGDFVYTASLAENTVAVVNVESYEVDLSRLGGNPEVLVQFAVAPDRPTMIAGGQLSGDVHFFDIRNPSSIKRTGWLTVGVGAWHPIFSKDGKYAYVPNKNFNTVTVIESDARDVATVITGEGLAEPHGSALSPDGRFVYVSNNNLKGAYTPRHDLGDNADVGTVVVIDTETNEIVKVLEVGGNATGIGARRGS